jgi:tRNA(fMet)-specific endonuclease VapC
MLDKDICSYIMKRTDEDVLLRLEKTPPNDICISAITLSELMFGIETSPRRDRDLVALRDFLRNILVKEYPSGAAADYAEIRATLKSRGALIGANDMLIAAHARHLGVILVTNNTREFRRVPGLKVENWASRAN